ncbi:hypothetical protein HOY81_24740 [Streptomyces sp. JJ36]|nr:hypothetical protein [Streptomyces sp. JJ36]
MLAAVTALGAAGAAGCSGGGEASRGQRERAGAARRLRRTAVRESELLLARYDSTAAVHPALAGRLAPLRAEVARHLTAFDGDAGSGRRGRTPPRDGGHTAVPPDRRQALAALAAAERRTADARARALTDAPPELARLLASVAAAGAAHAYLLSERDA